MQRHTRARRIEYSAVQQHPQIREALPIPVAQVVTSPNRGRNPRGALLTPAVQGSATIERSSTTARSRQGREEENENLICRGGVGAQPDCTCDCDCDCTGPGHLRSWPGRHWSRDPDAGSHTRKRRSELSRRSRGANLDAGGFAAGFSRMSHRIRSSFQEALAMTTDGRDRVPPTSIIGGYPRAICEYHQSSGRG